MAKVYVCPHQQGTIHPASISRTAICVRVTVPLDKFTNFLEGVARLRQFMLKDMPDMDHMGPELQRYRRSTGPRLIDVATGIIQ
jgi:hypothetical protein